MLFQAFGLQDFGVHATPGVIYVALSPHLAPLWEVLIPCDYRPRDAHPAPPVLNHQRDTNSQIASSRQRTYPLSDYVTHNCPGPAPALWRTLGVGLIFGTLSMWEYVWSYFFEVKTPWNTRALKLSLLFISYNQTFSHINLLELVFRKKNHWPSMMFPGSARWEDDTR